MAELTNPVMMRSMMVNYMMASPFLSWLSMGVLRQALHPRLAILDTEKNPLLRFGLKAMAYDQFCAGSTKAAVARKIESLRGVGYQGVALCYGRETVLKGDSNSKQSSMEQEAQNLEAAHQWKEGLLNTLDCLSEGDFLAIKFTGAGPIATDALKNKQPMPEAIDEAVTAVCERASQKGVRAWFDAEQAMLQDTIDNWTIDLMRKYNKNGNVVVSNTIQAYLKSAPANVARHVKLASEEGWALGIKLVRGAYIGSDPRHLIHDTAQDTHNCFDKIASDLINMKVPEGSGLSEHPKTLLFLATHNAHSVRNALTTYRERVADGKQSVQLEFGQLQGMADDVSSGLLEECRVAQEAAPGSANAIAPRVYKYLTWGTLTECLGYLYRRALENKGVSERASHLARILGIELLQRFKDVLGSR